jgi:fermentation-respiration switch protein FrsA (DUF1100 family)
VIAGARDSVVPIDVTRRLYAAFDSGKTLVEIPGADHNDDALLDGDAMIESILRFVRPL